MFFPLEVTAIPHVCCCVSSQGDVWPVPAEDQAAACARELVEPPARLGDAEGVKAELKVGFTPLIAVGGSVGAAEMPYLLLSAPAHAGGVLVTIWL